MARGDALLLELVRHRHRLGPVGGGRPVARIPCGWSHSQLTRWMPVGPLIRAPFWLKGVSLHHGGSWGTSRISAMGCGSRRKPRLPLRAAQTQGGPPPAVCPQGPALEHRHGALAAPRPVPQKSFHWLPCSAHSGLGHFHGPGLAAGGPPVQYLHLGGTNGQGEQGDDEKTNHFIHLLPWGRGWPAGRLGAATSTGSPPWAWAMLPGIQGPARCRRHRC